MAASPPSGGVNCTRADSVARFTVACCTPGTLPRARSTRPEQLAQVMPPMDKSSVCGGAKAAGSGTKAGAVAGVVSGVALAWGAAGVGAEVFMALR